jgi:hypothetical protein
MRPALVALFLAAACSATLLVPAAARAGGGTECRYLNQKIDHFERLQERARALENDLWVDRIDEHLPRARCSSFSSSPRRARSPSSRWECTRALVPRWARADEWDTCA